MYDYKIKYMRYNEMIGTDSYRKEGFTDYLGFKVDALKEHIAEKVSIEDGLKQKLLKVQSK